MVSLLQASIPYSFYNCRQGVNDKIDVLYGPANASSKTEMVDFVLLIPAGNYTAISLANRIKSLLEIYMNASHRGRTFERASEFASGRPIGGYCILG